MDTVSCQRVVDWLHTAPCLDTLEEALKQALELELKLEQLWVTAKRAVVHEKLQDYLALDHD